MAKLNPYKNTANELVKERGVHNLILYLRRKKVSRCLVSDDIIKNIELYIELKQHVAFNEGREQGKFESAKALKELIEVEDPEFRDFREIDGL